MENVVVSDRPIAEQKPENGGARLLWRHILPAAISIPFIVLALFGAYVGCHVRHNPLASLAASIGCAANIYFLLRNFTHRRSVLIALRSTWIVLSGIAGLGFIASIVLFPPYGGFADRLGDGNIWWSAIRVVNYKGGLAAKAYSGGWHIVPLGSFVDWQTLRDKKIEFRIDLRDENGRALEAHAAATVRLDRDDGRLSDFVISVQNPQAAIEAGAETAMRKCLLDKLNGRPADAVLVKMIEVDCPLGRYVNLPVHLETDIRLTDIHPTDSVARF
jgi:hypothetical protein